MTTAVTASRGPLDAVRPNKALKLTKPRGNRLAARHAQRDHPCWAACGQRNRRLGLERGPAAEHHVR
jgi:hypothetical protein